MGEKSLFHWFLAEKRVCREQWYVEDKENREAQNWPSSI
jgi:hypothetical protein